MGKQKKHPGLTFFLGPNVLGAYREGSLAIPTYFGSGFFGGSAALALGWGGGQERARLISSFTRVATGAVALTFLPGPLFSSPDRVDLDPAFCAACGAGDVETMTLSCSPKSILFAAVERELNVLPAGEV